jgi:Lamin Tail Domain
MFDLKRCAVVAGALLPLLVVPVTAGQADATSPVRISTVQYDSPGSDTGSNYSLNGEWVRITNYSNTRKSLTGWTLRDTSSHVYQFGTFSLGAGKSVRIHTGRGSNTVADRYQGRGAYVWNNTGDKAILRNGSGTTVSVRSW